MKETWTDYEKRIAIRIEETGNFANFLEYYFEEFEELVSGQCDVFQLAKEVFEMESIVDNYENLEGFLQNILNNGWVEFDKPFVNRYGLKISRCFIWFEKPLPELRTDQLVCYVVWGVNGTEILVHTSNKEFCNKYL